MSVISPRGDHSLGPLLGRVTHTSREEIASIAIFSLAFNAVDTGV